MKGWIINSKDEREEVKIDKDLESAYQRIINEVNKSSSSKQLIALLNSEHPTLKMNLLRAIIKSVQQSDIQYEGGKVKWHDGRVGKDVIKFAMEGTIPFI